MAFLEPTEKYPSIQKIQGLVQQYDNILDDEKLKQKELINILRDINWKDQGAILDNRWFQNYSVHEYDERYARIKTLLAELQVSIGDIYKDGQSNIKISQNKHDKMESLWDKIKIKRKKVDTLINQMALSDSQNKDLVLRQKSNYTYYIGYTCVIIITSYFLLKKK